MLVTGRQWSGQSRKSAIAHAVQRRAHVADAQAVAFERQRRGLRQDDGVEARHVPADEVAEVQPRAALRQPLRVRKVSAQKVSTSGACSTMGWSKCSSNSRALRSTSRS
jgi:hypothetical protein